MFPFIKNQSQNHDSVINTLPIPIAYTIKGKIIEQNKYFIAIFPTRIKAKTTLKTLFKDNCAQTNCQGCIDDLLGAEKLVSFECCSHGNNWYHIQIYPDPNRKKAHYVSAYDISQFKRRDELLSFSNKMEALGQLAGGVAHDFNNILSIVEGYAALIHRTLPEKDSEHALQIQRILQATRRGAGITRQLLTFGRHKIIGESVIALTPFFEELKNLLYPLLDVDITLNITLDDPDLIIKASSEQLSQIIFNAVTNARDAIGDRHGMISIHASRKDDDHIILTIHDDGCGMDNRIKARALEPFFTTKEAGKGTGLGLSQIYGMMQQLDGSLEIFTQKNKGTSLVLTFRSGHSSNITLPLLDDMRELLVGQTILIVDDEPDILFVLKNILESHGFIILTATGGNEALSVQEAYEHPINWLLSDVVMGDMNGPKLGQLFESIRPETKIIYMSGYPASGDMARIQLPEESIYLAKPIDPQKLLALMSALDKGESQKEFSAQLTMLAGQWDTKSI